MEERTQNKKFFDINKNTFLGAMLMLIALLIVSIVLTYIVPRGQFGTTIVDGEEVIDYSNYIALDGESGINIIKGIFAPVLVLLSSDGITVIMLSLFLIILAGSFQGMSDSGGIRVIVSRIVNRFKNKRFLLIAVVTLVFMLFGSILGLFEEMLTLLPVMVILSLSLGYDSFTGFLISIVACGFGFSTAISNPFTVMFASQVIGVSPFANIGYRLIIFAVMYLFVLTVIYLYTRKITKNPEKSLTYEHDLQYSERESLDLKEEDKSKFVTYLIFFSVVLAVIIAFSAIESLRDYIVPALMVIFLFGANIANYFSFNRNFKTTMKSFGKGVVSALPAIVFVMFASSIKYVLVEGKVLPTIINTINGLVAEKNTYLIALILFVIVLALEFFITSSTAKAMFIMSILAVLNLGISKENLVLLYTFADGYTNLLFPTSPVLLIGLSMIGVSYFQWLKKSWLMFLITFTLVFGFLTLAILLG